MQVGQLVPASVEGGGEVAAPGADRRPARTAVPVGVARIGAAVPVRVEVQVGGEFVAGAGIGRAAHVALGAGEGGGVAGSVAARCRSVTVEIPAHGVELGQVLHLDQPVVVGIVVVGRRRELRRRRQQFGIRATAVAVRRVGVRTDRRQPGQILAGRSRRHRTLTGRVRPAGRLVVPRIRIRADGQLRRRRGDVGGDEANGLDDGRQSTGVARGVRAAYPYVVVLVVVYRVVRAACRPRRDGDAVLVVGVALVGQRGAARVGGIVRRVGVVRVAVDLVTRGKGDWFPAHRYLACAAGVGEVPDVSEDGVNDPGIDPWAGVVGVGVHRADGHQDETFRHQREPARAEVGGIPHLALVVRNHYGPRLGARHGRVRNRAGVLPAADVPVPAPVVRADDVVARHSRRCRVCPVEVDLRAPREPAGYCESRGRGELGLGGRA